VANLDQPSKLSTVQYGPRAARANQARRVVAALQSGLPERAQLSVGKLRVGRQVHRVTWSDGRDLRFVFELDANAVTIPGLISTNALRMDQRGIGQLLRPYLAAKQERGLLDLNKGELRAFVQRGSLSLSITVLNDAFEDCTNALIRIATCILDSLNEHRARSAG
jgi:hypothetical protein